MTMTIIALRKYPRRIAARILLTSLFGVAITGCGAKGEDAPAAEAPKVASMPQSKVVTFGVGSANEGERIYGRECAFCHVGRNTGTIMLGRRMDADKAELHKRTDLDADYVKAVVRNGLVNMPPFSRVEITDQDLDKVAAWLARKDARK